MPEPAETHSSTPCPHCMSIPEGQPYCLHLLHALAEHFQDPDAALPSLLTEGVPTGIFDELPTSNQWQQRPHDMADDSLDNVQLSHCTGNWDKAERDPALLKALLQKEIDAAGHVKAFPGNRQAAEEKWPQRTAIGKLNIVIADNRDPRLLLDSTICNANTLCRIPEHVTLPSAQEVLGSFPPGDKYGAWLGIALDFKAAHKTVKIREDEQGTVLFQVDDSWMISFIITPSVILEQNSLHNGGPAWGVSCIAFSTASQATCATAYMSTTFFLSSSKSK